MSVYAIWNMATNRITTTAPTRALIERCHGQWLRPRKPTEVVCLFPDEMGLTITNYVEYGFNALLEGHQRFINEVKE